MAEWILRNHTNAENNVFVDETEDLLKKILNEYLDANVVAATLSLEMKYMTNSEKIQKIEEQIINKDGFSRPFEMYFKGAVDCIRYFYDYYGGKEPIYPSEFEDIFIKWVSQYADVKIIEE